MRSTVARSVAEFHKAAGQPARTTPCWPSYRERVFRRHLISEELDELEEAAQDPKGEPHSAKDQQRAIANVGRELADIVYVAYGAALFYGIDLDACIAEVHRANMDKLGAGGTMREDGKVLKPADGWKPPDVQSVIFPPKR